MKAENGGGTLNIAICDDEIEYLETLKHDIREIAPSEYTITINEYLSGQELLSSYQKSKYDVIILDIEMNRLNGIETAKQIRKLDKSVIIVFFTSHREFAIEGYHVNAFRYILKNQTKGLYKKQLISVISDYIQNCKTYSITGNVGTAVFKLSNIYFFEIYNKTVVLHTFDKQYEFTEKLSNIEKQLGDNYFIRSHKSYLVNLANVDFIEQNFIKMNNAEQVPLSRSCKENVITQYIAYITSR